MESYGDINYILEIRPNNYEFDAQEVGYKEEIIENFNREQLFREALFNKDDIKVFN